MNYYVNTLLTDNARDDYKSCIELMWKLCPDMMSRKIPEANVQQAFVLDQVVNSMKDGTTILSVGCYEDTAFESLVKMGYNVFGIDPIIDGSTLDKFYNTTNVKYDIVFSTSVIEHVSDDEVFIEQICNLLNPGGRAILTTDFNDSYRVGMPLPYTDVRFYTKDDLENRLGSIIKRNGCKFVNEPYWEGKPDFWYQGHVYSFATLVFEKESDV